MLTTTMPANRSHEQREITEVVLDQLTLLSIWRNYDADRNLHYSIDVYLLPDAVCLAADMIDGLVPGDMKLTQSLYTQDYADVVQYITECMNQRLLAQDD
jgi:hypothetical protein